MGTGGEKEESCGKFGEAQEVVVRRVKRLEFSSIDNGKGGSVLRLLSTGIVAHLVMGGTRLKLKRGVDLAAGTLSSEDQDGSTNRNSAHFAKGPWKDTTHEDRQRNYTVSAKTGRKTVDPGGRVVCSIPMR
jgi:hypothetical protein